MIEKKEGKLSQLIKLIAQSNRLLSGEELGAILGISRTAVWKYVKYLREKGFKITGKTNTGYKLIEPVDTPLTIIPSDIETNIIGKEILSFIEIDSTNNFAKTNWKNLPNGTLIVTEKQTSGRGRRGRIWTSPFGTGLYFSIILKPSLPVITLPRLTIVAGVSVALALERLGVLAKLKWPNDIMIGEKKIGGILSEMSLEGDEVEYVILGIGINVHTEYDCFPEDFREKAGSIKSETGKYISRNVLLKAILGIFENLYTSFCKSKGELGEIRTLWEKRAYRLNEYVEITTGLAKEKCIILGLKEDGALLIKNQEGKIKEVFAGEVLF
jgi:BirA family biotin operon repressor/biotin-[acetyl-CoA-carboxylase] ligase